MLMRGAVLAVRQRRALARLALARRRTAARDAAVQHARLDLLLDEPDGCRDALAHGPSDLRLRGDRKVTANVLEERAIRPRKIVRIAREPLHRLLACGQYELAVLELDFGRRVRIHEVLDRAVNRAGVLIHAFLEAADLLVH